MTTTACREQHGREAVSAHIGAQVLLALGEPPGLVRVQVRPLWGDAYRVNVLVGADITSARVAHSYFLAADGEGNVVSANPPIRRED